MEPHYLFWKYPECTQGSRAKVEYNISLNRGGRGQSSGL